MASITLRDIPVEMHERLKREAAENRRSLNQEILYQLKPKLSPAEALAMADQTREMSRRLGIHWTDREINRWKREGRP